jgi:hypothetical protein
MKKDSIWEIHEYVAHGIKLDIQEIGYTSLDFTSSKYRSVGPSVVQYKDRCKEACRISLNFHTWRDAEFVQVGLRLEERRS